MVDNEIVSFASSNGGRITSVLPLLDHLSRVYPDVAADELVRQVDAAFDRLYRVGRAWFAGHRWLNQEPLSTVAGFLQSRIAELRHDTTTHTWSWSDTAWTENITVR